MNIPLTRHQQNLRLMARLFVQNYHSEAPSNQKLESVKSVPDDSRDPVLAELLESFGA